MMEMTAPAIYTLTPNEFQVVERDDEDLGYLWFADRSNGDVRYIMLTRSYHDGRVHFERDDQKWAAYGGVTSVDFDGTNLVVRLDKSAATALGGVEMVLVDCRTVGLDSRRQLETTLWPLLAGTNVPVHVSHV